MRYAVISQGLPLSEVEAKVRQYGGQDIRVALLSGQVFAELDPEKAQLLARTPGLAVRPVERVSLPDQTVTLPQAPPVFPGPVYAATQTALSSLFFEFRSMFAPPVTGLGFTIAILDSGIRATHLGLKGKVVYEQNFTSAPTAEDKFDHGTGVAYLAAGGKHALGEDSGMAPGANLMNLKVINDSGSGTSEDVVQGLEKAMELFQAHPVGDPLHPDMVNISFGAPDLGDPLEPARVATRTAVGMGLWVVAAAGNSGPAPGTIGSPATDPLVFAVGVLTFEPFQVWEKSSRGPTKEGVTKPDLVFFGINVLTASGKDDASFSLKAGTSFAAPVAAGMVALVNEGFMRSVGRPFTQLGAWQALPFVTRKPRGAPPGKDNTYGFGMPMGDLVAGLLRPRGIDISSVLAPLPSLMGLVLMAGLVKSVVGGRRK